jgi:hypothetical protein
MHCHAAVWPPLAPALAPRTLAVAPSGDVFVGCADGSIAW